MGGIFFVLFGVGISLQNVCHKKIFGQIWMAELEKSRAEDFFLFFLWGNFVKESPQKIE